MALYTFTSKDDFARLNRLPSPDQTAMWNAMGRNAGQQAAGSNDNFFTKKARSIDNAIGTTGAAIAAGVKDTAENIATKNLLKDTKTSMNDIAKKYGYNTWNDWQDGFEAAKNSGDTARVAEMENQLKEFQAQANTNANKANEKAAKYKDYMQNNDVSKRINQDPGKFAGSAINTLSTATDVLGLTNGPLSNAIQGGIEGLADELEQNGLENFSWERARQNAITGATSGAVAGAFNKGVNSMLAKRGGNLFKGGDKLTQSINDLGSKTALGRGASTVATGITRGALSGAVGGGAGGGVSALMNGQDVIGGALQGAAQGAKSGAMAGGIMAGANMAINKTPGVGTLLKNVNQAQQDWQNSGDGFGERFKNTINSGDSAVGNVVDNLRTGLVNRKAVNRLANGIENGATDDIKFVRISQDLVNDINNTRVRQGFDPLTDRQVKAYMDTVNNHLSKRVGEGMTPQEVAEIAYNALTNPQATAGAMDLAKGESNMVFAQDDKGRYNQAAIGKARTDDGTSLKTVIPDATESQIKRILQTKEDVLNSPVGVASPTSLSDEPNARATISSRQASSTIPQGEQNVNTQDKPFLAYGESELGNRTRRGMVADSLERLGNTLEGAQTNVTRAAAKDLGIESTGKVVENVRRKTGITNLETQAAIAKELTGGANSLMDSVQKMALGAGEDGQPFVVDTTPVINKISQIVDSEADTNMFGSQTAKEKFIKNLKTDLSVNNGDIMSLANRMKANAADLRGRGVASPSPADSAKAKIYTKIANELDDLSYKAIPQDNVENMFDATIAEMRGRAQQAANNGNKDVARAYTKLADSLNAEPRTIKAFRSFKKDFVDVSKINELTARAENGAAMQMGRGIGGGIKRFADTLLQRPVNAGLAKIGGAVNSAANKISGEAGGGDTPTPAPTGDTNTTTQNANNPAMNIYNAIGRQEGLSNAEQARTANYLTDAVQEQNTNASANSLEQLVGGATAGSPTSVYSSVYGTPTGSVGGNTANTGYFQPTGDYWTDILGSAMSAAIDADDVTAFAALYGMYQDSLANLEKKAQSSSGGSQKLTATQQRANAAMNSLDRLASMNPDLGYQLSGIPIIGDIATFGGNDYESEAGSLAQQIGYMVSGANIKEEEARNIGKAYVPQPWDSEATRRNKLMRAREIIRQYQASTMDDPLIGATY